MEPWLAIVGLGEDGPEGLSVAARGLIDRAELLVGGRRHLAMVGECAAETRVWDSPLATTVEAIAACRGRPVCVLATGDPMHYGIGVTLARRFGRESLVILPTVSAFSLACARLGWPVAETIQLTLHGRPLDLVHAHLAPDQKLLILSEDAATPPAVCRLLDEAGYGRSEVHVFCHMGGRRERSISGTADSLGACEADDLNTMAVELRAGPEARLQSRIPGLPDGVFRNDGQITRRDVRAVTVSALMPFQGHTLWDVGAGCGSVSIEWMRAADRAMAIAIERDTGRCAVIAENASALGVPGIRIVAGSAPCVLDGLDVPDAVFIGGGIAGGDIADLCWEALDRGGRMVANAVTLESEHVLQGLHARLGGELLRLGVSHAVPLGGFTGWKPAMAVTQWRAIKP